MGRKWANIVAKKNSKDGQNAKVYAKFGTDIYSAAKKGTQDPATNADLHFVINRAKKAQVPKHVIENAIEKAKGNNPKTFTAGRYEGFGPKGAVFVLDTLTNNSNRTAAGIRTAFKKNGGNMGVLGSVSYFFDHKGVIVFSGGDGSHIFSLLLEKGVDVDDVEPRNEDIIVYTTPKDLHKAVDILRENGVRNFKMMELDMVPRATISLFGDDLAAFGKLYDALEKTEDVQKIYTNVREF